MKNILTMISFAMLIAISITACGWKPDVTPVAITTPWSTMNLPIKENAVIWVSTPTQFKAVHKEDKKTILGRYADALKAAGWTLSKFDDKSANTMFMDMEKGSEKIAVQIYDFQGTGVIIDKS